MKTLLMAAVLLGASFSGLTINAKAGGKLGIGSGGSGSGQRLVECRQPPGGR